MLYKFKSKNTGDIIMLQASGQQVLQIIGKASDGNAAEKGIILPEQMPAAISALQAAVVQEEADRAAAMAEALANNEPVPHFAAIALRQRTQPFIQMLQRCQQDGDEVVWGV
jgi:hypothetical protein